MLSRTLQCILKKKGLNQAKAIVTFKQKEMLTIFELCPFKPTVIDVIKPTS